MWINYSPMCNWIRLFKKNQDEVQQVENKLRSQQTLWEELSNYGTAEATGSWEKLLKCRWWEADLTRGSIDSIKITADCGDGCISVYKVVVHWQDVHLIIILHFLLRKLIFSVGQFYCFNIDIWCHLSCPEYIQGEVREVWHRTYRTLKPR